MNAKWICPGNHSIKENGSFSELMYIKDSQENNHPSLITVDMKHVMDPTQRRKLFPPYEEVQKW